ncbi:MAG: type 1 glutamine amidotransferase domain-containing protein [Casimicrobiaceae bacterium]
MNQDRHSRQNPSQADAPRGALRGKRVAILATDGFEQVELTEPRTALEAAGARADVIAPKAGEIRGWNHADWGARVKVDRTVETADAGEYDALLLPGGVLNPDALRQDTAAVRFVRAFFEAEKPVAAICHGPILLIEADVLRGGRKVTSWPSIATDIRNAGGQWSDREVVIDGGLVTSRKPADIPAFNHAMIDTFASESRNDTLPEG